MKPWLSNVILFAIFCAIIANLWWAKLKWSRPSRAVDHKPSLGSKRLLQGCRVDQLCLGGDATGSLGVAHRETRMKSLLGLIRSIGRL
jgi:hypothetical protein